MKHLYFLSIILLSALDCISAQTLDADHHLPLTKDSLLVYKIPYLSVTYSGRNCTWDFSGISTDSAEMIEENYFAPVVTDTMHIGLHREHANYYYHYTRDTLWMTGYETSRAHMRYSNPLPLLHYPFGYGDSLSRTFAGKGQYCHLFSTSIEGSCSVHADAIGRLILPDVESDSILRVHYQVQYRDKTSTQNCVREERYIWYSPYFRYPLLETVYTRTIRKTDTATFASSYYIPQEPELAPIARKETEDDSLLSVDSLITDVSYLPNPVYADLHVKYSLVRPARVYISVHYNGGVTTYQTPRRVENEGTHTVAINMAGMPMGSYVIYIHADDEIVSGNIIKL